MTACPHQRYREMRASSPVVEIGPNMFAVTRYEDCLRVLMDWRTFSARVGDNNSFAAFGPSPVQDQIDAIMRDYPEEPVLMRTDPPVHTRVRKIVSRVLAQEEVDKMTPHMSSVVDELLAPIAAGGSVEFVGAFAALLPNAVTTRLLGAGVAMRATFKFWADEVMSRFAGPQSPERQLEVARNIAAMGRYFLDEIASRRALPGDDLVSKLAHAEVDGDRLEDVAVVNVIETFLIGGHETTTFLLGAALWRLANDQALAEVLRTDVSLVAPFIEEMLRLESPAVAVLRSPVCEASIGGATVPAGATLLVLTPSANRDDSVFATPDELVLGREQKSRHLAFGAGVHTCVGLNLARTEARVALQAILSRWKAFEPDDDDPVDYVDTMMLRGPKRLNLKVAPA